MSPNLDLITEGGRCPICFRTDVRSIVGVIQNCDATLMTIVDEYARQQAAALVLTGATLKSTTADLRCCMGICKPPLP